MLVSIIVPFKNAEKYIDLAKENFSRFNEGFEIIFVNNNSNDEGEKKLKDLFPKAHFLSNNIDNSPGISRNIGMDACSGEKIIFCDIDDFLIKENIDRFLNMKVDIVIGHTQRVIVDKLGNESITIWKNKFMQPTNVILPQHYNDTVLHSKIFDAKFLKNSNVRFIEGFYEDKLFLYELYSLHPSVEIVYVPMYKWYVHYNSNSATNLRTITEIEQRFAVINLILKTAKGPVKSTILFNFYHHDLFVYIRDYKILNKEMKHLLYNNAKVISKNKFDGKKTKTIYLINKALINYHTFNLLLCLMNKVKY